MSGKGTIDVEFTPENFAIIRMRRGENRLNPGVIEAFNAALDKVESNPSCRALITTGEGKFFSNGLDLEYVGSLSPSATQEYMQSAQKFLARILTFPMPTVAAVNGHAFAGGAFIAFAHDLRVMRKGQGWISLNEIHIQLRFPVFFMELFKCKVSPEVHTQLALFGKRFTAPEALEARLIDSAVEPGSLIQEAKTLARRTFGKAPFDRQVMGSFKKDLYEHILDVSKTPLQARL